MNKALMILATLLMLATNASADANGPSDRIVSLTDSQDVKFGCFWEFEKQNSHGEYIFKRHSKDSCRGIWQQNIRGVYTRKDAIVGFKGYDSVCEFESIIEKNKWATGEDNHQAFIIDANCAHSKLSFWLSLRKGKLVISVIGERDYNCNDVRMHREESDDCIDLTLPKVGG